MLNFGIKKNHNYTTIMLKSKNRIIAPFMNTFCFIDKNYMNPPSVQFDGKQKYYSNV